MMTMTKMITIKMLMVTLVLTMKRRKISATLRLSSPCAVISGDDALQMNKKELWLRVLPSTYLLLSFLAAHSDLRLLKALLL